MSDVDGTVAGMIHVFEMAERKAKEDEEMDPILCQEELDLLYDDFFGKLYAVGVRLECSAMMNIEGKVTERSQQGSVPYLLKL